MADDEEGSSPGARVLALLEAAATAPDPPSSSGDSWLVYCGAQWHPGCVAAQRQAQALREEDRAARQRLVYVSSDVDDAGVERAKAALPHCAGVVRDEAAAELLRLLDVTVLPTVLSVDATTGAAQLVHLPLDETEPPAAATTDSTSSTSTSADSTEENSSAFATALRRHGEGDWAGALEGFARALEAESDDRERRADAAYNIAALLHMLGKPRVAVHYTALALESRPEDPVAHVLLGTVLAEAERGAVVAAYRRLVPALEAQGRGGGYFRAAHRLAALTGEGASATAAAREYVREVFDAMAEEFEEKLVEHLGYRVPWQLLEAVGKLRPPPQRWRALDLGCGSGLCGRLFQPYCQDGGAMVGVDLAPKMVAKAEATGHYTELRVQDANAALAAEAPGQLDLLISADTFIYVGALEATFAHAARALRRPGGLFAFSIEEYGGSGFRLVLSGRYAHAPAYVERLAAQHGLGVRAKEAVVVRQESGQPIPGWIYVLEAV